METPAVLPSVPGRGHPEEGSEQMMSQQESPGPFGVACSQRHPVRRVLPSRTERQLDALGDLITGHLDTAALLRLIEGGAPAGLPLVTRW
jgi:hypothetical protein